jgi:hypothetical protein
MVDGDHKGIIVLKQLQPLTRWLVSIPISRQRLYSFGMNLLACPDPNNMTERSRIFAQAIDIFKKLFANPQTGELDILLGSVLKVEMSILDQQSKGIAIDE